MQSSKARIMESLRETPETIVTLSSNDAIPGIHRQDPSLPTTSPNRPKFSSHRFALLSPPSDYDLRSLPPTPQESSPHPSYPLPRPPSRSRTDKAQSPTPPTISPKTPQSPSGSFAFPSTQQKRKLSTTSQQSGAFARTSVASTLSYSSSSGAPSSSSMPPNIPVKSPLRRPAAKSTASFTGVLKEYDLAPDSPLPISPNLYTDGSPDPNIPLASQLATSRAPSRSLPQRPSDVPEVYSGSLSGSTFVNSNPSLTSFAATITPASSSDSASVTTLNLTGVASGPSTSKRQHALLELLSSERAYAGDLAVVRDIHIPLSRGHPPPFEIPSATHHLSSISSSPRSSTHTTSTASSAQTTSTAASSLAPPLMGELPMTLEASKIIFGNIDELAVFADRFGEKLEVAMGNVLKDGVGDDRVGALFLDMIPVMAPLYKTYITRHPTALAQFQSLPPSPALTNYISTTRALTTSHTHAWDIPSLLIKPVQRLLKYPLLLGTIYADTPESHPDKATLLEAKEKIEEVARMVNEGRRRWEVVKTVLGQSKPRSDANGPSGGTGPKSSATPKMSRMRSFRTKVKAGIVDIQDLDHGKQEVERWEKRIKECEMVTKDFARLSLEWNKEIKTSLKKLKAWNTAFGEVVGLGEQGVEAVGAFGKVVSGLLSLEKELDAMISGTLLQQLSNLLKTLSSPRILLTHMHTLRHSHVTLLNTPYNKSRPPSALLEASNDYLALQATLREELSAYIQLFEKGLGVVLLEFSKWQKGYWRELRDRWISFWVALAAEGEGNESGAIAGIGSGAQETVKIWWERFGELEEIINSLGITAARGAHRHLRPVEEVPSPLYRMENGSATSVQERSGPGVYQKSTHSHSAQDLADPKWIESPRNSGYSTPSLRGRHRRNASDTSEILPPPLPSPNLQQARTGHSHPDLAQMMSSFSIQSSSFLPHSPTSSKRDKSKGREKDRDAKPPKASKKDPRSRTEPIKMPVPQLLDPWGHNVGGSRSTPGRNTASRSSSSQKYETVSNESNGGSGSRIFRRRLTDALFGAPRSGNKHGRSKSLTTNEGADGSLPPPTTSLRVKKSADRLSGGSSSQQSKRSSLAPFPSQPASSEDLVDSPPTLHAMHNPLEPPPSPLYACATLVQFKPLSNVPYMNLPFLTLHVGDTIQVLYEAGHPSEHPLPFFVDEGDDCLLVVRDEAGRVGWAFASFLVPLT
ncbi:hypothetical protein FRB94_013543 [Tulasnella sp. JGI-2019a]|nr:hypothetical protein FRB93_005112 [Tulasnella sp. JGI-2019a]KAG9014233.1 hypothetical protein FRB94_013543 [Tulasnella sp. JGI-2019a]